MSAILLAGIGLGAIAAGYRFYSKFIAERIYQLDPTFETPAHTMRDDIDYVPTNKVVLWGHHFTAVAGAAPIIGPGIAVIWGWLPAFVWVVAATVFFAGVHDFGAVWVSVRNGARSVGAITGDVVSQRARTLFMIVIFLLLLMVNAVFAVAIADALRATPSSVIPVWSAIVVALTIGVLIYRFRVPILWPTVVGTIVLYAVIYLGEAVPVQLPEQFLGLAGGAQWIIILFVYAAVASLLPVWLLLQPRDYINGIQLFIGLGLLYLAVVLANPTVVAPAINPNLPAGAPPLVPFLFVTVACGAISGFHGLVGSGTTSKQLNKETDARFVGYLGSAGEGALALVAIIATTAGFASLADWETTYSAFGNGGLKAFVQGGAVIVTAGTGISEAFARTLLTVMAVLFAGTTMDAGRPAAALYRPGVGRHLSHSGPAERLPGHVGGGGCVSRAGLRRGGRGWHGRHAHLAAVRHHEPAAGRTYAARHQRGARQAGTSGPLYARTDGLRLRHGFDGGPLSALGPVHGWSVSAAVSRPADRGGGSLRRARSDCCPGARTAGPGRPGHVAGRLIAAAETMRADRWRMPYEFLARFVRSVGALATFPGYACGAASPPRLASGIEMRAIRRGYASDSCGQAAARSYSR